MSSSESDPDYLPPSDYNSSEESSTDTDGSSSEFEENVPLAHLQSENHGWLFPSGSRQKTFPQSFQEGTKNIPSSCDTEFDVFRLFVDKELMDLMVQMTNCYANKTRLLRVMTRGTRLNKWKDCDEQEMWKFLGLLVFMGLNKLPKISDYWSKHILYQNKVAPLVMSRNRFELLLRCWHFEDTIHIGTTTDRLIKIRRFVEMLNSKFQNYKSPGEYVTIDETMVGFRGRIIFMQYLPGKRHKYGIKLYKICDDDGYTHDLIVYEGKKPGNQNSPTNIVMKLCDQYLGVGRSVVTDNFYTSIDLASKLLEKNTHLIGTLRKNRKGIPKRILKQKLKKGEMIALENNDGIHVLKWKDKRDVLFLSTKHSADFVTVKSKRNPRKVVMKPKAIVDYNKHKCAIDYSDQMASYTNPARRSVRWFQKLAVELLFSTAICNAYIIYKTMKGLSSKKYTITSFKENLCVQMMNLSTTRQTANSRTTQSEHMFGKSLYVDHRGRFIRRRCTHCYEKKRASGMTALEARNHTKKVNTVCLKCPTQPSVCAECYGDVHKTAS